MATISVQTKKFADLTEITDISDIEDSALCIIHDGNGVKKITVKNLRQSVSADGAGAHNATYRGKDLGTSITTAQYAAIADGTFKNLYIGDYWTINGTVYRIAAFDYYYGKGDTKCATHHIVIVPDKCLASGKWNDRSTTGGYVSSVIRGTLGGLSAAYSTVKADFGTAHIMTHRNAFVNAVVSSSGAPAGRIWEDSNCELLTERNLLGNPQNSPMGNGAVDYTNAMNNFSLDSTQFPLFAFDTAKMQSDKTFWLQDTAQSNACCAYDANGRSIVLGASTSLGVRPAFCIA